MNLPEIYNQYKNLVFNLAIQYVQNIEDAEEITQDVFLKIHQNISKFEQRAEIKTWIYRITINTSLDFLKSKNTQKRISFFTSLFIFDSNKHSSKISDYNHPGVVLENKEATARIFRLINELPDNQRTAIILSKIEGKSQKEISEIMQKHEKAVESLIQRAKLTLQLKIYNLNEG